MLFRALGACVLAICAIHINSSHAAETTERWIYASKNLQVDSSVTELESLLKRGHAAGYTHLLLTDSKFARLGDVIDRYFVNARHVRELAQKYEIEIVPAVFSIGYSNDLLFHDPNLVEALPVEKLPLVIKDGVALVDDPAAPALPGGDMADLKKWSWKDDCVIEENGAARIKADGSNARLAQKLTLKPFRQYHVRVRIKTADFRGQPEIKVLTEDGTSLQWANLGVQTTQDWTEHHAVFNSQKFDQATLYLGVWGAAGGALWWDDAAIEEVAFLNLARRNGCPLTIETADGRKLQEGKDFAPLTDPQMGTQPWAGEFNVWHAPPKLTAKLPDGTKLLASYCHAITVYDGQAMICPSEPKTIELLRDNMRRVHELWGAQRYMMQHDEIRVLNHCAACRARGLTPGQILADNVKTCIGIIKDVAPGSRIYVWNDMFDPHHNAVPGPYYLVNGSLAGSWEGLNQDVRIVAWHFDKRAESLKFFADRGHKYIIAGYYDAPVENVKAWLQTAQGIPGCEGVMYTTWHSNYSNLEPFAKAVSESLNSK
jgi:hypothetical protein